MTPMTSAILASVVGTGGVAAATVPCIVINRNKWVELDNEKTNLENELGKYKTTNNDLTQQNTELTNNNNKLTTENSDLKDRVNNSHNYLLDALKAWINKHPDSDYTSKKSTDIPDNAQCTVADGDMDYGRNRQAILCYIEN